MKLLISGSRSLKGVDLISKAIKEAGIHISDITEVIHGGAFGIDKAAGWWAENNNIPVKVFKADWKNISIDNAIVRENDYGKYNARAGIDRNEEMGQYADFLLAIWDGKSKGTLHMIEYMKGLDKEFFVYEICWTNENYWKRPL